MTSLHLKQLTLVLISNTVYIDDDEGLDGDAVTRVKVALYEIHQPVDLVRASSDQVR